MIICKIWTLICFLLEYPLLNKQTRNLIFEDFKSVCRLLEVEPTLRNFVNVFATHPEFRSVTYMRVTNRYRILPKLLLKPQPCLYISMQSENIGGGLMMMHGFATVINAGKIGRNCTVFQQVTIGYSSGRSPEIGDDCTICSGAKIYGGVHIGNNVTVAGGAVVVNDVPDNVVVAGNPARIVASNVNRRSDFPLD